VIWQLENSILHLAIGLQRPLEQGPILKRFEKVRSVEKKNNFVQGPLIR
jgi:hypothetical protein